MNLRGPSSLLGHLRGLRKGVVVTILVVVALGVVQFLRLGGVIPTEMSDSPRETRRPMPPTPQLTKGLQEMATSYQAQPWPVPEPAPVNGPAPVEAAPAGPDLSEIRREAEAAQQMLLAKIDELQRQLADVQKPVAEPPPAPPPAASEESAEDRRKRLEEAKKAEEERIKKLKSWKPASYTAPALKEEERRGFTLASPYSLTPGHKIPVTVEIGLSNQAPGDITVRVRERVWDSATGRYLLIPQDAAITGTLEGATVFGDDSLKPVFRTLTIGSRVYALKDLPGADMAGMGGFRDQRQAHWGRLLTSVVLTGVLRGGSQAMVGGYGAGVGMADRMTGSVVSEGTQRGAETVKQFINTAPTLTVRPGYRANLVVREIIEFPEPYRP